MRYTSYDGQGVPLEFSWPYRMDFKFAITIVSENSFSLEGKEITFIIQEKKADTGVYLLSQNTSNGNISVSGLTITGDIPFQEMQAAGIVEGQVYNFGITIGDPIDGIRMQGWFKCIPEAGRVPRGGNNYTVSFADFSATIDLAAGSSGGPGPTGPAGPWEATSRRVTSSGAILATDTLVFASAYGADIVLTCPAPADLWDGQNGRVIIIARTAADTGTLTITGSADGLPLELFSSSYAGESVYITTTDGIELIVSDAPFVVQVTEQGAGSYLELEFTAADLVDDGLPLPVLIGNVPDESLVRTVVVRFTSYFDAQVQLSVGQAGQEKTVFFGTETPDEEGYETFFFIKFSGAITLTPNFATAPTVGSGTIFLTY